MENTVETFKTNIESVEKLINFDREVLDIAITSIEELHESLLNKQKITNDQLNGKRTLDIIKGIRTNDSLKSRYSIINNQSIVLLVSYFSSAVADLFRYASQIAIETHKEKSVLDEEIKIKVSDLSQLNATPGEVIGDLLISKNNISFQDMKSIQREFKKYFGIKIEKDDNVNNIILSQACRHSIAHEAGIVNKRILNQLQSATPRNIKQELKLNDLIEFSEKEIKQVSESMLSYVSNLSNMVNEYSKNI
jgi:hypothetical protein